MTHTLDSLTRKYYGIVDIMRESGVEIDREKLRQLFSESVPEPEILGPYAPGDADITLRYLEYFNDRPEEPGTIDSTRD